MKRILYYQLNRNIIEELIDFFKKRIIDLNINIKFYKINMFYYQLNVVIKQFLLLKNINDNIYNLLIRFLNYYQRYLKSFIYTVYQKKIVHFKNVRDFFFDFLLNPNLYKESDKFDLLTNINTFLDSAYNITKENVLNNELLTENILSKILRIIFVFKEDEEKFQKIKIKYIFLLINYLDYIYSESKGNINIIIIYYRILTEFKENNPIFLYNLSLILFTSKLRSRINEFFIGEIINIFEENYQKENNINIITSTSSMLLVYFYYILYNKNRQEKIKIFKTWYLQLSQKTAFIYFEKIFNLIIGGKIGINVFLKAYKENKNNLNTNDLNIKKFFEEKEDNINYILLIKKNIYDYLASLSGYENISKDSYNDQNNIEINTHRQKNEKEAKINIRSKIELDLKTNIIEISKIKNNMSKEKYYNTYYTFFDDIENRYLLFNPKNILIKRFFSHIFYKSLFHCKAFIILKNKYLISFPEANVENKQLNYPSKIKNFSNIYEPKLFFKKYNEFYHKKYFPISHDYMMPNTIFD